MWHSLSTMASMAGSMSVSRACLSMRPCATLLTSSLVHAKCVNSATAASSALAAMRRLSTYSTALTSWLVVRSTSLTSCAISGVKFVHRSSSSAAASGEKRGTSGTSGSEERSCSQRHSTSTRYLMSAYSEKQSRRLATCAGAAA